MEEYLEIVRESIREAALKNPKVHIIVTDVPGAHVDFIVICAKEFDLAVEVIPPEEKQKTLAEIISAGSCIQVPKVDLDSFFSSKKDADKAIFQAEEKYRIYNKRYAREQMKLRKRFMNRRK